MSKVIPDGRKSDSFAYKVDEHRSGSFALQAKVAQYPVQFNVVAYTHLSWVNNGSLVIILYRLSYVLKLSLEQRFGRVPANNRLYQPELLYIDSDKNARSYYAGDCNIAYKPH